MPVIIDGYNLLHASGVFGPASGPGDLQHARAALLDLLADSLPPDELEGVTVVFDAQDAPPNLPRAMRHRGMAVEFAPRHQDADTRIAELVDAHDAPRSLVVVSSDRRVQRAVRKRRGTAVASDRWFAQLLRQRRAQEHGPPGSAKPQEPLTPDEVHYWLEKFSMPADPPPPEPAPEVFNPFPPGYAEDLEE